MKLSKSSMLLITALAALNSGCIAASVGLATKVVGTAVNDADIKKKRDQLVGKSLAEADKQLGPRLETLHDPEMPDAALTLYAAGSKKPPETWYVVELREDNVVAIAKKERNTALGDKSKAKDFQKKLIGKPVDECEKEAKFGKPNHILHSRETGDVLRVYDVSPSVNLGGARYCVLRFDKAGLCKRVSLVGVVATSEKGGLMQGQEK